MAKITETKTKNGIRYGTRVFIGRDTTGKTLSKYISAYSKRELKEKVADFISQHKDDTNHITVGKALQDYISIKESVLSPSTLAGYKSILRTMKSQYFWFYQKQLEQITTREMQALISQISQDKTPKTVRNWSGLISAILRFNGFREISVTLPQKVQYNRYIPSEETIEKVVQAAKGTRLEIPILLAAYGPMRRGEICGLSLDDIHGDIVHVRFSMVEDDDGNLSLKAPKTLQSDREILYPHFIIEKILKQGYVTDYTPKALSDAFPKFLEKNGFKKFRFHDLRHFGASYLHSQGIPDAYILARGGWKTDGVMKSIYRHTLSEPSAKYNKQLIEKIESNYTKDQSST